MKKTKVVNINSGDPYDVFIGRPSRWGNPFKIGRDGSRKEVIDKYKAYIKHNKVLMKDLHTLKGKHLGCFCKPKPCHGDVLIELIEQFTK